MTIDQVYPAVIQQDHRYPNLPYCLDAHRDIRFVLGDGPNTSEWIEVRLRQRDGVWCVEVVAGDVLQLTPTSGNSIRIRVKK